MARAVVFAYHNVGVRCLKVLLAHGVDVPLVVTHEDSPGETIWFGSAAHTAAEYGIPVIKPQDPSAASIVSRVTALAPDFVFSFYYRLMLTPALLACARRGALNMHGSLLPKYRGRAPVNWAVLHGARETGATLHYMADKPDSGDIVAQQAVPILPDDTAREVFDKVTLAAEIALDGVLPALVAGTAPRHPGAFTTVAGVPARMLRTRVIDRTRHATLAPTIEASGGRLFARCGGGGTLEVLALEIDGAPVDASGLAAHFGAAPVALSGGPSG